VDYRNISIVDYESESLIGDTSGSLKILFFEVKRQVLCPCIKKEAAKTELRYTPGQLPLTGDTENNTL
jgi:hypothetical protein